MGHMIPKLFEVSDITVQVKVPAKEIEPLKEILPDADFYEAILDFDLDCIYWHSIARGF